jgi:hypothetical protein
MPIDQVLDLVKPPTTPRQQPSEPRRNRLDPSPDNRVCFVCVFQQTMMLNYFADNFENVETIRTCQPIRSIPYIDEDTLGNFREPPAANT